MPSLALSPDAGEAAITAVCEVALLHRLLGRSGRPLSPPAAALSEALPPWLAVQAASRSVARLVTDGPALALTAPLILDAALGPTAPIDRAALLAAVARLDPMRATTIFWRQREFADLIARIGARPRAITAIPVAARLAAQDGFDLDDGYCFTHEVFHQTGFGARHGPADWRSCAARFLDATMPAIVEAGHRDLIGEYWAAARCLRRPLPVDRQRVITALSPLAAPSRGEDRVATLYHPRLVLVLASRCGVD